jgi:peptidoglycan/xylan/chitin deacetylase (PgdA/CDA1 family)
MIPAPEGAVTLVGAKQRMQLFRRLRDHLKTIPHSRFRQLTDDIVSAGGVADPPHNNVLGWDSLRQLDQLGVTLAPHTHTHPMLNQLSDEEIRKELKVSCAVLEAELGHSPSRTLAYPAGGVSDAVVSRMISEGFDVAFSTQRGVNSQSFEEPFRLRRINVGAGTNLAVLRLQMANWGT